MPDAVAVRASFAQLAATGRAKLPLTCTIDSRDQQAVTFEAAYAIHAKAGR